MKASLLALALLALVALPACGGKVVLDGSGSSGNGGATTGTASSGGGGGAPSCPCPMFPPAEGSTCACAGASCPYDQCAEDGPFTTATCTAGAWSLAVASCMLVPCGEKACPPGDVCLHVEGGAPANLSCIPDPCGASPLACSCATSVCPDDCLSGSGTDLFCGCDNCP
jgi:hypothetical protein